MIVRDYYFASWAIERGIPHTIEKGVVHLNVDKATLIALKKEYAETHKGLFDRVKRLIKTINKSRLEGLNNANHKTE